MFPRAAALRQLRALLAIAALAFGLVEGQAALAADAAAPSQGLASQDPKVRADAIDAIGDSGAEGQSQVAGLVAALKKDVSPDVRWKAARALASVGEKSDLVVNALADALNDETPIVQAYSAYALGMLDAHSRPVVEHLSELTTDKEGLVRRAALRALQNLNLPPETAIPLFVKTLSTAEPDAVVSALRTIADAGEKAVPFLQSALEHPRAAGWACVALSEMGPAAKGAAPGLIKLLARPEPNLRLEASMALGSIGPEAKPASPALARLVSGDRYPGVRYAAAFALGSIGDPNRPAIAALEQAAEGQDKFLCTVAAWSLARIEPQSETRAAAAVNLLIEGLQSDNSAVRMASVRALQDLKAGADKVGPALVAALKDADPAVAANAIAALGSMGPQITPHIVEALKNPALRGYGLTILERFGPDAKGAVPELIALLGDPATDAATRREIHFLLGQIGPAAAPATQALVKSLGSDSEPVRNSAIWALGQIGPGALAAAPALRESTASDDRFLRVASLWALLKIMPGDAKLVSQAIPELTKALGAERELVQVEAARTLGLLGADGRSALPALKKSAQSQSPLVADAAGKAIDAIEGRAPAAPAGQEAAPPAGRPSAAQPAAPGPPRAPAGSK